VGRCGLDVSSLYIDATESNNLKTFYVLWFSTRYVRCNNGYL